MNDDVRSLLAEEKRCLRKFNARAAKLMAADPNLTLGVARGKAVSQMPNTCNTYTHARQRLTALLIRPLSFDEA